jgi:subtilisin family serine protease
MQRYTVLRDRSRVRLNAPLSGGQARARSFEAALPPVPTLEVESLTPANVRDLNRDPEIAAIAPIMPTRLLAPLASEVVANGAMSWGIGAVGADASPFDGTDVAVAVLDTGIDAGHVAFQGVNITQKDFTGAGNGDAHGHGTHCAGTIFGRDVNGTRIGVARGVKQALIGKVLGANGGGTSDMIFKAINWASEGGAHVVSMSLGFDFPGLVKELVQGGWPVDLATSAALEGYISNARVFDTLMALNHARGAFGPGTVVVAAAGNESHRDQNPDLEVSASLPSAANDVIAVGALDKVGGGTFKVAAFSNTNPDLSAPGVDIISAKRGGGLVGSSGTSMACPHVAGVTALWWQAINQSPVPRKAEVVLARMRAAARANVFAPGTDVADRGEGLAMAPAAVA